jgi:hypothetical protein
MPRVSEVLLQATIYLYTTREAAEKGDAVGGSGFLVGRRGSHASPNITLYFVTCDHVASLGAPVVRVVTRDGTVEIEEPEWVKHPDFDPDVAVAPFRVVSESGNCPYSYIPIERFVVPDDLTPRPMVHTVIPEQPYYWGELVGAGDDTLLVGRFLAEEGVLSQTPTVRFGNLASAGPVTIEFTDAVRPSRQECFLVESRSLPGYSGSAVYLFHPQSTSGDLDIPVGLEDNMLWRFLGIDCGHMSAKVDSSGEPRAGWEPAMAVPGVPRTTRMNAGMMTVVPAWKIAEALEEAITRFGISI